MPASVSSSLPSGLYVKAKDVLLLLKRSEAANDLNTIQDYN